MNEEKLDESRGGYGQGGETGIQTGQKFCGRRRAGQIWCVAAESGRGGGGGEGGGEAGAEKGKGLTLYIVEDMEEVGNVRGVDHRPL